MVSQANERTMFACIHNLSAIHLGTVSRMCQVIVRALKPANGSQRVRDLKYVMRRRSVTAGELRSRISREMAHPANQASLVFCS